MFSTRGYAISSLVTHVALFGTVYSVVYFVFYVVKPGAVMDRKLSKNKYPPTNLVRKEIMRCVVNVIVVWLMDLVVMLAAERGFLEGRLHDSAPPLENRWLPRIEQVMSLETLGLSVFLLLWSDAHFYFTHRLLHEVPFLYRQIHKIHHESFNPDTFSGLSFHPVEGIIYFSSMLAFLLVPYPMWMYHMHRLALILAPLSGHTAHTPPGAEYVKGKARPWLFADPVDHWIHHTKFNYNFGSGLLPRNGIWDNLLGTAYRESDQADTSARAKSAAQQAALAKQD